MDEFNVDTTHPDHLPVQYDGIDKITDHKAVEAHLSSQPTQEHLSAEERKDVNAIKVEITNKLPTIVLYGAAESGKTMALVRLTRYLRANGYTVEPVTNFRPAKNTFYANCCKNFDKYVNGDVASDSTNALSFLLLLIKKDGEKICQILEAPGEHYFNKHHPDASYPSYIQEIITLPFPKIWLFVMEKDWESQMERYNYSVKIIQLFKRIKRSDDILLLYNKADKHGDYLDGDRPRFRLFLKDAKSQYPLIFSSVHLHFSLFIMFFRPSSRYARFIVFSSGHFADRLDDEQQFTPGIDYYPETLWKAINNCVKGKWL